MFMKKDCETQVGRITEPNFNLPLEPLGDQEKRGL